MWWRWALCSLFLCPFGTSAWAAEGEKGLSSPNVLLITVDTLRADALGWIGGGEGTPNLDRLAREGFRFPAAVAPAPITQPSHASLFTGLLPRRHGLRDNGQVLGRGLPVLAERLREAGYHTAGFISGFPLAAELGFGRGFDHYDDHLGDGSGEQLERRAEETTAAALRWLESAPTPWFVWVHYFDAHDPYVPPEPFRQTGGSKAAYAGEVAYVDHSVGRLLKALPRSEKAERLIVFAADHGEALGDHGEATHGFFIYQGTMAVPLVFHFPGRLAPRGSEAAPSLVDVAPTILDLLSLPSLGKAGLEIDGHSLVPFMDAEKGTTEAEELPPAYMETRRPWISYGWSPLRAVRQGPWKLIAAPKPELYHLGRDPLEAHNLVNEDRRQARRLQAALRAFEERPAASAEAADSEALAKLHALGYVGAGVRRDEPPPGLPDPKDRLEAWEQLSRGQRLLVEGQGLEAVRIFDQVLKDDPTNRFALSRSGLALLRSGQAAEAAQRLARAAELEGDDADVRGALAQALLQAGKPAEAVPHAMELTRLHPWRSLAWLQLATALGRAGRAEDAVAALERATELAPERPDLLARLAFAENGLGRKKSALGHLRQAAEGYGEGAFPYASSLGLLLATAGKGEEARSWLRLSRPGEGDYAAAQLQLARLELEAGEREAAGRALTAALAAAPELRARVTIDPQLGPLLEN